MKILAHSKENRGNELITYQFGLPTYLLPELLKFKKMEVTWIDIEPYALVRDLVGYKNSKVVSIITLTSSKPALEEFFDKCCPKYKEPLTNNIYWSKKKLYQMEFTTNTKPLLDDLDNGVFFEKINQNKITPQLLQELAEEMYDKYYYSKAIELKEGDWHIPYNNNNDLFINYEMEHLNELSSKERIKMELRLATALISNPQETDYYKLLEIYDQLLEDNELDTFAHCARVMNDEEYENSIKSDYRKYSDIKNGWCESYKGFISYKNIIENETNYN